MPDQARNARRFAWLFVALCLAFGVFLAVLSDHIAWLNRIALFPTLLGLLLLILGLATILSARFAAVMDALNRSSRGRLYQRFGNWLETRFPERGAMLLTRYIPGLLLLLAGGTFIYVGAFVQ